MTSICSENGCEAKAITRGMCNKHYRIAFKAGKFEPVFGLPIMLRLERKSKINPETGCLEWTGAKTNGGYGKIGIGSKTSVSTHRAAWEAHNGIIPDGMCILHKCDNRACVNPKHLSLGTYADNHADMDAKGRRGCQRGEKNNNGAAKLTAQQVREILRDPRTLREIGADYGLSFGRVGMIKRGQGWKHITNSTGG